MPQRLSHWHKRLDAHTQPAYLAIADLIAEDVASGRLGPRDRLPTLRDLAEALKLNYTTVARAYGEARKRGLVDSRTGYGTYVRSRTPALPLRNGTGAEMTMNMPPEPADATLRAHLASSAAEVLAQADMHTLLRYQDFGGTPADRAAAVQWLRRRLPGVEAAQVLVAPGIHALLLATLSLLARPGELVCVESLVYPGLKAIAAQLGVQLHALPLDDDGPDPDAFAHACRTLAPRAFVCNPTLANPTAITWSRTRREAIVDVALRYSIPLVEDDAYGMLPLAMPPTLAALAPELTWYLSGFSKCLGAGLRTGYVRAPNARQTQRLAGALRALTVMASPVTNALVARWVEDGTADAVLHAIRAECTARQALASRILGDHAPRAPAESFHAWLALPDAVDAVETSARLRSLGVAAVASTAFSTDGEPPNAMRLCLGGPIGQRECGQALELVAEAIEGGGR